MVRRELLIATSTFFTCGLLLQTGAQYSAAGNTRTCVEIRSGLAEAPQVVPARRRKSATRCNLSCYFFKVLREFQHPVQAHTNVLWSLLKHQAFVVDKHAQFPFSFSVFEMVGGRNCLAYAKLKTPFPKVVYQDSHVFVEALFHCLPRWMSQ